MEMDAHGTEEKNPSIDFPRGKNGRMNTHQSTTDPKGALAKKGHGKEAKLCFTGHVLMENRKWYGSGCQLFTQATGTAEREAALDMLEGVNGSRRATLGADKGL